jgi:threonine dehydrogenase-like Zn-dependent dehydrogenase
MEKMKALVTYAPNDYRLEEVPISPLESGEILLKTRGCGICASDIKAYHGSDRFWGPSEAERYIKPPVIGGHELCGEIVDMAKDVKGFKKGDFIVTEQVVPCNECVYCKQGMYWNCQTSAVIGFKDYICGGFAEYVKLHKYALSHKVPESFTTEQAVLVEPLACGMHAVERAEIQHKDVVVVGGLGAIGLGMLDMVKLYLPRKIIGIDLKPRRLEIARTYGIDAVLDVTSQDVIKEVMDMTEGLGCDVYIEASGTNAGVKQGLNLLRHMGTYVQIGAFPGEISADWNIIGDGKELNVKGSHLSALTYPAVIKGIETGVIRTKELISHSFKLDNWKEAFEAAEKDPKAMKVMIVP